jgi:hypothetical protein
VAEIVWLRVQITRIEARLACPLGARADKRAGLVSGSRAEWHAKARRLHALKDRLRTAEADWAAGRVHVVRGGKQLAHLRHHLGQAGLEQAAWRERWRAARMFLAADGESGKRFGNETIRITGSGQISIRLPAALAHLANAPHGRYVLDTTVVFRHRGEEWADRIGANRVVVYRIHQDVSRGRWYVTASWQRAAVLLLRPVGQHTAPGRPDPSCPDPAAAPHPPLRSCRPCDQGPRLHRRQVLREARPQQTLPPPDLPLPPPAKLKARLVAMAAEQGIVIVAVDPAYTSRWGPVLATAPHQRHPQTHTPRRGSRSDRKARPRTPDPATDGTAPTRPERSCAASDRPGPTGGPTA